MKYIAIIGVGGLGSRHLQSLGLMEDVLIQIVDISEESKKRAIELFYASNPCSSVILEEVSFVSDLHYDLDVVIIATSSRPRYSIVEELLTLKRVKFLILEKVLFPRVEEYGKALKLIENNGCKAWVNHPRRMFQFYKVVAEKLKAENSFSVDIAGGNWGLGCNCLHYIDLIKFLSGADTNQIIVDASGIDDRITDSKRKGYIEFTGKITGNMGKCKQFYIHSIADSDLPGRMIISSDRIIFVIIESQKKAYVYDGTKDWFPEEIVIDMRFQRQLTFSLVNSLFMTGTCELPSYEEATKTHLVFIEALIDRLKTITGEDVKECPIT